MVGQSQVKANLEKLEALKKSVKDIQVRFTVIGNVNKIRDDFSKLKNKIITVKVNTSTAQLDALKKKLNSIRDKTVKLNINLPKSSEVDKLEKFLGKLTSKKVKIEITITPDLTIVIKQCIAAPYRDWETDRKSTRLNSSHSAKSRMPSSA